MDHTAERESTGRQVVTPPIAARPKMANRPSFVRPWGNEAPSVPLSRCVNTMMRLAGNLNVARASARRMSTQVESSLTQFETRLTENARQLLGDESPTTVLPLVREVCRTLTRSPLSSLLYSSHAHSELKP